MRKLLLLALVLVFATSCDFVKDKLRAYLEVEDTKSVAEESVPPPVAQYREVVYSCAFEGHLNMRAQPSFSAKIVGKFRNGPHGAFRLKNLGGWSLVEVNGVVGYVVSRYLQHTPTIPYTGRVGLSWIEGVWYIPTAENGGYGFGFRIFSNGYWEYGYDYATQMGYYVMQNKEVKLVTVIEFSHDTFKWEWTGAKGLPNEEGWILSINERAGTLEGATKEDWPEYDLDECDYPYAGSLAQFRSCGQEVAKKVSAYMSK